MQQSHRIPLCQRRVGEPSKDACFKILFSLILQDKFFSMKKISITLIPISSSDLVFIRLYRYNYGSSVFLFYHIMMPHTTNWHETMIQSKEWLLCYSSPSRWISAVSAKREVRHLPPIPASENQRKYNVKPSSSSQSDSAQRPISGVFPTWTKEKGFDNFYIWYVASFITANFDRSLICSLHRVPGGSRWTSRFAFIARSSPWTVL